MELFTQEELRMEAALELQSKLDHEWQEELRKYACMSRMDIVDDARGIVIKQEIHRTIKNHADFNWKREAIEYFINAMPNTLENIYEIWTSAHEDPLMEILFRDSEVFYEFLYDYLVENGVPYPNVDDVDPGPEYRAWIKYAEAELGYESVWDEESVAKYAWQVLEGRCCDSIVEIGITHDMIHWACVKHQVEDDLSDPKEYWKGVRSYASMGCVPAGSRFADGYDEVLELAKSGIKEFRESPEFDKYTLPFDDEHMRQSSVIARANKWSTYTGYDLSIDK